MTTRTARARADAKAADRSAREHYHKHEYEAAIGDYQHAYDALPDPLFLFDMAQAYRKLARLRATRQFYREYLQDRPDADDRDEVERFIAQMDACTPTAVIARGRPRRRRSARLERMIVCRASPPHGLGLALIGAGVYFSADAGDDAGPARSGVRAWLPRRDVAAIDQSGHDANRNAAITYAFGGAALAAGARMIVWATLHGSGEPPAIAPTPGGATARRRARVLMRARRARRVCGRVLLADARRVRGHVRQRLAVPRGLIVRQRSVLSRGRRDDELHGDARTSRTNGRRAHVVSHPSGIDCSTHRSNDCTVTSPIGTMITLTRAACNGTSFPHGPAMRATVRRCRSAR